MGKRLQWETTLYAVINGFVPFMQLFSGLRTQEVNKAMAATANPLHHSVLGICLKGSMIDSDLARSQFRGND